MVGERVVIVLFTVLGALLALIGVMVAWMANAGMVQGGVYVTYGMIALGIVLVFIGLHLFIAGVASLRKR